MSAVRVTEMLQAEALAISQGWTEISLMQAAGEALGHAIARFFPIPRLAIAYIGKGHNAGDALIALQVLKNHYGWNVATRNAWPLEKCAPLVQKHAQDLKTWNPDLPNPHGPLLLIDGLVGTGSQGPLRQELQERANEMHKLRHQHGALIAAVDIPSGIDPDTGFACPGAVIADVTFMIANAKAGLLTNHAATHTGALALVPVPALSTSGSSPLELFCPQSQPIAKAPRPHNLHKGSAGRVQILAGSETYPGAAVLAATGALRGGAGMVTLHVPVSIHHLIATTCPPEVIVCPYKRLEDALDEKADARVAGCGLGALDDTRTSAFLSWLQHSSLPTVIDADALNLIAAHHAQHLLQANHVITPHPGEFLRLMPETATLSREEAAQAFSKIHPATLLLKGTHSITSSPKHLRINPTGHAGMATAGQGDLLAGVIGSQLAAGHPPHDAAALGAWLCGRAAEIATQQPHLSQQSLTPSDVAHWLGAAFRDWQSSTR